MKKFMIWTNSLLNSRRKMKIRKIVEHKEMQTKVLIDILPAIETRVYPKYSGLVPPSIQQLW
jgi:hypothetical protein